MMWQNYFKNIALINLLRRPDRLQLSSAILDEFKIKYEVWEATDDINYPCRGLVDSMQRYFCKCLDAGAERCLIFEDDIAVMTDKKTFNETMDACVEQLPDDWDIFYLGCNVAGGLDRFHSKNLLPIRMAFATHATAYSKKTMEFIVRNTINEPVDNFLVREYHPISKNFVSYPMLMSQRPDHSDIGGQFTDWTPYLEIRYESEIKKLL